MDIAPGDWVEAIRTNTATIGPEDSIIAGHIYKVLAVDDSVDTSECADCSNCVTVLALVESPFNMDFGWCICNFRPIYRPKHKFTCEHFTKVPA